MNPSIHNEVRAYRQGRRWTQQQLAQAVGVSRQSINSIERGRYVPSLGLALALARVFGCTTEALFRLDALTAAEDGAGAGAGAGAGGARPEAP